MPVEHEPDFCKALRALRYGLSATEINNTRRQFLAWCAQRDEDPGKARAAFAAHLAADRPGDLIARPPARNQPCWCGSGREYKKSRLARSTE